MSDYYQILGVSRTASAEQIKKAYRRLAVAHHPDRHGGDVDKTAIFQQLNEAYQVLSDADRRRLYDSLLIYGGGGLGAQVTGSRHRDPAYRPRQASPFRETHRSTRPAEEPVMKGKELLRHILVILGIVLMFFLGLFEGMSRYSASQYAEFGLKQFKKGHHKAARFYFHDALDQRVQLPDIQFYLGKLYLDELGETMKAIFHLDLAIKYEDDAPVADAYFFRGEGWLAMGNREKASWDYKKTLEISPNFLPAYLRLGDYYLYEVHDFEKAIGFYKQASRSYTSRVEAWTEMGVAYQKLEKHDSAEYYLALASLEQPDNPVMLYHLGRQAILANQDTLTACNLWAEADKLGVREAKIARQRYCTPSE